MQDNRSFFAKIFVALMIFTGLVWVWTVAFIISWPWEKKDPVWKPDFHLVAVCSEKKAPCGIAYGDLAEAKAKGTYTSLEPAEPAGDIEEEQYWLQWKKDDGIFEVKSSSWHFQTTLRYKVEDGVPVLIAYQDVEAKAFYYGVAAALFSLIGLYLRRLRR
jgi:hypothetical protein